MTWCIFLWRIMSSLRLTNLKEEQQYGGITAKHPYATRQTTHKNLEANEMTFTR